MSCARAMASVIASSPAPPAAPDARVRVRVRVARDDRLLRVAPHRFARRRGLELELARGDAFAREFEGEEKTREDDENDIILRAVVGAVGGGASAANISTFEGRCPGKRRATA
tara:strand:+ start:415 stop:753 length:339 start_codon:yes stop_codon:yes gene_type:complete